MLAQHGLGIRPECARVLRVLTMLLQKAAARGLTPFAIGSIMCRCGHALACNSPAGVTVPCRRALLAQQRCCRAVSISAFVQASGPHRREGLPYVQGGPR